MKAAGPRALRFRLLVLAVACVLPLLVAALAGGAWVVHERRQEAQRSALNLARALGSAVDAELGAIQSVLGSLALSPELSRERMDAFMQQARRLAQQQGWRTVVVADGAGKVIASSAYQAAVFGDRPVDPESLQRAIALRKPVVGNIVPAQRRTGDSFAVRVPVERDGALAFVLTAVVDPERIEAVVQRQRVPEGMIASVLDGSGTRVARSLQAPGRRASPSFEALVQRSGPEGTGQTTSVEGMPVHTGFSRLPLSGWMTAVGISQARTDDALRTLTLAIGAGVAGSLALAAFLAWYFSRGITRPIDQLKDAAGALGRGEQVQVPALPVAELDEVGRALAQASAERQQAAQARAAAEAEREALLARVTEALEAAEEAGRSKDQFLAVLGHELRNPLAPISTALHLMALKGDAATAPERELVQRQLAHMTRLVDDLLDVSRITGRRLSMRSEPVALAPLLAHACDAIRPVLGGRTLQVDVDPAALHATVRGDDVRLGQVFNNLLGNALKFTPAHGRIQVRLLAEGQRARVEVSDDGVGMDPEVLAHAFDLFYQAPQGSDRSRGGLGLGLAIVRSLVEMHGGSVRAESAGPGLGARVVLELPIAEGAPTGTAAPVQAGNRSSGRLLVVDDNRDAADTAAALLEMSGYEVQVAYHPDGALAIAESFQPDAAVLDIGLPGISGYELAQRLRAAGYRGKLLALTGYGREADVQQALAAGFDMHLTKPVSPERLLEVVAQLTSRN